MSINNKILNQLDLFLQERDKNNIVGRGVLSEKQFIVDTLKVYLEAQKRLIINDQQLTYDTTTDHV